MKRGHVALIYLSVVLSTLGFCFGLIAEVTTLNRGSEQIKALRERNTIDKKLTDALNRQSDILERAVANVADERAIK